MKVIPINKVIKELGKRQSLENWVFNNSFRDGYNTGLQRAIKIIKDNIIECDDVVDNIEPLTTEEIKLLKHFIKVNKELLERGMFNYKIKNDNPKTNTKK